MKVNVEFDLEKEEDEYEFKCHLNATKYRRTLAEIYYRLRNIYKHGEGRDLHEKMYDAFFEELEADGLTLEDII
jgi:hypothetical protein